MIGNVYVTTGYLHGACLTGYGEPIVAGLPRLRNVTWVTSEDSWNRFRALAEDRLLGYTDRLRHECGSLEGFAHSHMPRVRKHLDSGTAIRHFLELFDQTWQVRLSAVVPQPVPASDQEAFAQVSSGAAGFSHLICSGTEADTYAEAVRDTADSAVVDSTDIHSQSCFVVRTHYYIENVKRGSLIKQIYDKWPEFVVKRPVPTEVLHGKP